MHPAKKPCPWVPIAIRLTRSSTATLTISKGGLTKFQPPPAPNTVRLNPFLELRQSLLGVLFPGEHLLERIRGKADLRAELHHIQKDDLLDPERLDLVETLSQLLRFGRKICRK